METETLQLKDVVADKGVTIEAFWLKNATLPDGFDKHTRREWSNTGAGVGCGGDWVTIGASAWSVTLEYQGRKLTVPFYQGSAHTKLGPFGKLTATPPTAADVLYCLCSDASAVGQLYEEWASDLGYGTDSRKAHATYQQCVELGIKVKRLLGADFETFARAEH